jgi:hypothetical protein
MEIQDLPGSSDFIFVLTLYILRTDYPETIGKVLFNRNTFDIMNIPKVTIDSAREKAVKKFYGLNLDLDLNDFRQYLSKGLKVNKNPVIIGRFRTASNFLKSHYNDEGKFIDKDAKKPVEYTKPENPSQPGKSDNSVKPAPLVPVKPETKPKPTAPSAPKYKTREEVIQELMSQGKITDPSQAVALSSPVTVNGRTFQALISPLGTLPGPGGVRVPIINDQQANSYAMSILKEYNRLAGVGYQPLNDISKGNLDSKNVEPLKKLLTRIDLSVNNKTSHEQTADGEPILPQMREPKLSADTENLYKILKRLSGQTLDITAEKPAAKSVTPAQDRIDNPTEVKKNDVGVSPVTIKTPVTPADIPNAAVKTNKTQVSDSVPGQELSFPPPRERVPRFNAEIVKDETLTNQTDPNLVIDSSKLYFQDENNNKIPGSDTPAGFFEHLLDWFETSEYYSVSNKMSEADFIKRINDCKTPNDKNNVKKCWTVFPEFIMGKLSSILGTYRTSDNLIYKTLTKYIPLGVTLNIDMIINLIEANDPRYSNLSESFIGG